jgi:hypothetical protein
VAIGNEFGRCFYCITFLTDAGAANSGYDNCVRWFRDGEGRPGGNFGLVELAGGTFSSVTPAIGISGTWDWMEGIRIPESAFDGPKFGIGYDIYSDNENTTVRRAEYLRRRRRIIASIKI